VNELSTLLRYALETGGVSLPPPITIPIAVLGLVLVGIVLHDLWRKGGSR
jgi:hypothetical protein